MTLINDPQGNVMTFILCFFSIKYLLSKKFLVVSICWPSPLFESRRLSSSLVFITTVTHDSMSVQIRSDWSIGETIVSGVSSAPTAWPTASLATSHFAQTKSARSALSTGESQYQHISLSLFLTLSGADATIAALYFFSVFSLQLQ